MFTLAFDPEFYRSIYLLGSHTLQLNSLLTRGY